MQKFIRIGFAAALIALAIWGWWVLFPSPERVIRSRLTKLTEVVSFEPNEGNISKAFKAQKLTDYFHLDVEISIDAPGYPAQSLAGRDELMRALLFAQSRLNGLKVQFLDMNVKLSDDRQSAVVNLTAQANLAGERDFNVQELNITLTKVEGRWLISKIETVKTLSLNFRALASPACHES